MIPMMMHHEPDSHEEALEMARRGEVFVCYQCKDHLCSDCIGVPCMCPCRIYDGEPEPEFYI